MAVKKIAVLGGGMGSLTAVYELTSDQDWQSKYDITIYHMGWRFGGKGASGRNGSVAQRIEEHGLHLWFGFYDNAFELIQRCYKDNNRSSNLPLSKWEEAFSGYDSICLEEKINGQWLHWPFTVPSNGTTPGIGGGVPTKGEYVFKLLEWMKGNHDAFQTQKSDEVKARIEAHKHSEHMDLIRSLMQGIAKKEEEAFEDAGSFLLHGALELAKANNHSLLFKVLGRLKEWWEIIVEDLLMSSNELRRYFIMADLGIVTIRGMIADDVITGGFNKINGHDYREWLAKHRAAQVTLDSAIVQAVYGLVFGGDRQYTFEAGTALRGFLRLGLTYKGHIYYRMMAGMGDAIFGPMYEVLKERKVKFEFFHKVTNLGLSSDKKSIATISIDVQATIKPQLPNYDPLVNVKDLPCWPSEPIYKQLVQGDDLKNKKVDLASYYSSWPPVQKKILNANSDFDVVLLGISIGALPTITTEFTSDDAWKNMLKNVIPISTIAFQVWLKSSIAQMGWPYTALGLALVGSYQEPYDTWADMSDLLEREDWPSGYEPKNLAYFCGPTPQPNADEILRNAQTGNFGNPGFPAIQTKLAKDNALEYLNKLSQHIWPGIWNPGQKSFDFNQLIDLNNGSGTARFDAQFFRANIDPTELYVMSFTNSSQYRIKTDKTEYNNLYITGDWIDCGFNAGCIEATVMSGKQAARAISKKQIDIPGENDL